MDVYSYGILMWTVWTQKLPYSDLRVKNPFQLMVRVTGGYRPPIPSDVMPASASALMQRCWTGDPKDRPDFDEILKELKGEMGRMDIYKSNTSDLDGGGGGGRNT